MPKRGMDLPGSVNSFGSPGMSAVGARSTHATTIRSRRAHEKLVKNMEEQKSEALNRFKVMEQFKPERKTVEKLTALDRKPAGQKLFQGVVKPGYRLPSRKEFKRGTNRRSHNPHDIF